MAEVDARIEQFRKMASDDPDNELGHFSLGRALLDAGKFEDAVGSFRRTIQINPNIGKAYQLLATALLKAGAKDEAIETLKIGATIANTRGDFMPKNEMLKMLKEHGVEMPELASTQQQQTAGEGEVLCNRCGQVKPKLAKPPFNNDQGRLIQSKTCPDCWKEWIGMGTKVINELRLPLHDPQAQKLFDQHMMEFLNLT